MMNKRTYSPIIKWLILVFTLSACSFSSGPPEPIYYYTLDYSPSPMDNSPVLPVTIRVDRFSVSPPFDTQRMFYADKGLHRNAYAHHQWVSPPGELLAYLIARDLRDTDHFQTILTPDSPLRATHIINGWVEEFLEIDDTNKWRASLCLHITLLSEENRDPVERILSQKTYRAAAASRAKTPEAIAEAMSEAAAQVSAAVIKDIYLTLGKNPVDTPLLLRKTP